MIQATAMAGVALSLLAPPVAGPYSPCPSNRVAISIVTVNGSGCPRGTTEVATAPDNAAFTVTYNAYLAQAGRGASAEEERKNCQLVLSVRAPRGFSYSIVKADYRGFASIVDGAVGWEQANYYFQGQVPTARVRRRIAGPFLGNWQVTHESTSTARVWSPCGIRRYLNVNTALRVDPGTSDPLASTSLMSMDSTDASASAMYHLEWKKCS